LSTAHLLVDCANHLLLTRLQSFLPVSYCRSLQKSGEIAAERIFQNQLSVEGHSDG